MWERLIVKGRPRDLEVEEDDENDVVIFTDGSWPEPGQSSKPMIGAVVFDKTSGKAWSTAMKVPEDLIREWLPRKTQIAMVEMLAPIVVNEVFKEELRGKKAILLVDSESVEGALVKGYSARSDMTWLTAVFWDQLVDLDCLMYIDRISTDGDIADGPSRGRSREAVAGGWEHREAVIPGAVSGGLGSFKRKLRGFHNVP